MNLDGSQSNPDSETLTQLNSLHKGEQPDLEPEALLSEPPAEPEDEAQDPAPNLDAITIDGKTFSNAREAYEYSQKKLQESETEKLVMQARQEAFEQAMAMGQTRAQAQATAEQITPESDDTEEFYANPQEYLKNKMASIRDQVRAEIRNELNAEEQERQTWSEFFRRHPDLEGFRQDCDLVLNQNLDTIKLLAAKDRDKAMDYLATKTREKFQSYMERLKPQSVLPNTHAGPSVGGNPVPRVTPNQKDETPLDFVSEIRNLNKR